MFDTCFTQVLNAHTHTHIHIHTYTYIHTYISIHIHTHTHIHMINIWEKMFDKCLILLLKNIWTQTFGILCFAKSILSVESPMCRFECCYLTQNVPTVIISLYGFNIKTIRVLVPSRPSAVIGWFWDKMAWKYYCFQDNLKLSYHGNIWYHKMLKN